MKLIGIALVMCLIMVGGAMGATYQEALASATVTVNTFVDITLTQCPGTGTIFNYGNQDPGATNVPIACQDGTDGALRLTVEDTTNTPVTVDIKGTNYIGTSESIPVGNTDYDEDNTMGTPVALTDAYVNVWASMGGTDSTASDDLWFWLDIPSAFLTAGDYTSTYTLKAL